MLGNIGSTKIVHSQCSLNHCMVALSISRWCEKESGKDNGWSESPPRPPPALVLPYQQPNTLPFPL